MVSEQAILQLEKSWEAQGGACESACVALRLWDAHGSMFVEGILAMSGEETCTAQVCSDCNDLCDKVYACVPFCLGF